MIFGYRGSPKVDKSNGTDDPVLAPLGYILFPVGNDLGGGGNSLADRNVHRPSVLGTSSRTDGGGAAGLPGGGGGTGLVPELKDALVVMRPLAFGGRAAEDETVFEDCELGIPRFGGGGGGGFRTPCGDMEFGGRLRVCDGGAASVVGVTVGPRRGGGGGGAPLPGNGGPVLKDARRPVVDSGAAAADKFDCIEMDRDGPPLDESESEGGARDVELDILNGGRASGVWPAAGRPGGGGGVAETDGLPGGGGGVARATPGRTSEDCPNGFVDALRFGEVTGGPLDGVVIVGFAPKLRGRAGESGLFVVGNCGGCAVPLLLPVVTPPRFFSCGIPPANRPPNCCPPAPIAELPPPAAAGLFAEVSEACVFGASNTGADLSRVVVFFSLAPF